MVTVAKKAVDRTVRQENRAKYAPKQVPKLKLVRESADEVALKKLTGKVLQELKNPSAIPSQVIMAALLQVRAMK